MVNLGMGNKILRQILLESVAIRWQSSLKVQESLYLPLTPILVERPTYKPTSMSFVPTKYLKYQQNIERNSSFRM